VFRISDQRFVISFINLLTVYFDRHNLAIKATLHDNDIKYIKTPTKALIYYPI